MKTQCWPDNFDFQTDEKCQSVFKPFIERHMIALQEYDARRHPERTYIFPDHCARVEKDVHAFCLHLGLGERIATNMAWAVRPHDIGKARLPLHIWDQDDKPGPEIKAMTRTHIDEGAKIVDEELSHIEHPFKDLMLDIMLNHHEMMDGTGPRSLKADQISMPVRLCAIVEAFDGWSIPRPHFGNRDISPAAVITKMREEKGPDFFDMGLLNAFKEMKIQL